MNIFHPASEWKYFYNMIYYRSIYSYTSILVNAIKTIIFFKVHLFIHLM